MSEHLNQHARMQKAYHDDTPPAAEGIVGYGNIYRPVLTGAARARGVGIGSGGPAMPAPTRPNRRGRQDTRFVHMAFCHPRGLRK